MSPADLLLKHHGGLPANSLNHVLDFDAPETSNNDLNNNQFSLIIHSPFYDQEEFIQHHSNFLFKVLIYNRWEQSIMNWLFC